MFKVKSSLALCAPSEGSKDCPFYSVFQSTTNDLKKIDCDDLKKVVQIAC